MTPDGSYPLINNMENVPPFVYPMLMYSMRRIACLKHSSLFKVNVNPGYTLPYRSGFHSRSKAQWRYPGHLRCCHLAFIIAPLGLCPKVTLIKLLSRIRNSTKSVLTATVLVYTLGAGITAAAGTRLALQLLLAKLFKFRSSR